MNRIEAIEAASLYVTTPHLVVAVDGVPLDALLHAACPGLGLLGLVPALLGWFHDEADTRLAWQRAMPPAGRSSFAPVLICPDDLDLKCSVVVAEVVAEADTVAWPRLGLDHSEGAVGSCVRWLPGVGPFRFPRGEYEACLAAFSRGGG